MPGLIFGLVLVAVPVLPVRAQQAGAQSRAQPGDQIFSFGINQKIGANDNIRLDPNSVGTTYYSDTTLTFGFDSLTQRQQFNFSLSGVLRAVDDPVIGTDSDFRDPSADLFFQRDNGNERLTAYARYDRPDLAFLNPLTQVDINGQDITRGEGSREDISAGLRLETGLQGPFGVLLDVNTRERNYVNNNDPALFGNRTDNARGELNFRLSPVSRGRVYATAQRYRARDNQDTKTDTNTAGIGLTRDIDPVTVLDFDLGYSRVSTTTQAVPPSGTNPGIPAGQTDFEGYVARVGLTRQVSNGQAGISLDSALNRRGRQSTLEITRDYTLPLGSFGFSLGATTGDSFDVRPIGSLNYAIASQRSRFNVNLARTVKIDESLNQITENTRVGLGYVTQITPVSSFDFQVNYADVALTGNNTNNPGRDRLGATAAYVRDVGQDWQFRVGYGYRAFYPEVGASSSSNEIFFSLQKTLDIYR
ncbi:MAG: hypothetical protein ACWA5A_16265 [Marinibacterium sp.]